MSVRPKLLDLFCGAGGAAMGYHRAGFNVLGVDIEPQPNYPFEFHQADALDCAPVAFAGEMYDAIHASPPCQAYSDLQKQNKREYPYLIWQTRRMLRETGLPYVIENVEGAPLVNPVTLCGVAFPYLRVIRHRLFEASFDIPQPRHWPHPLVFTHDKRKAHYGRLDQDTAYVQVTGGGNCTVANKRAAMGIDWMTGSELNEAIPPAYTEYVGTHLMAEVQARRETADAVYSGPLRGCQREDLIRPVADLVAALQGCRFALHCALLGYEGRDDQEGVEITAEVLAASQATLITVCAPEPPPPICSGCSPIKPFEDETTVAAWRELHPREPVPWEVVLTRRHSDA